MDLHGCKGNHVTIGSTTITIDASHYYVRGNRKIGA